MLKKMVLIAVMVLALTGISIADNKTLTFQWDQVWEPDVTGWKLYYGTAPGTYGTPIDIPLANATQTGTLPTGERIYQANATFNVPAGSSVTYYFALSCYDSSANESGRSNEINKTIDFKAPSVPLRFR